MNSNREPDGKCVVIGGGLAGVRAALELAENGWQVTLLEARPRLGGRAYSFARDGLMVDTSQHVILRCYSEYLDLVRRIGAETLVPIQPRLDISVLRRGARSARLRRTRRGIAPLHLLPALMGYSVLTLRERIRTATAMAALRGVDPDAPENDRESFGGWLRRHGQDEAALARFWGLISVAALNIGLDQASLALAARVFRTGFLENVEAGDIGMPAVPLSEIHDAKTRRHLDEVGVDVHDRERVARVDRAGDSFIVRTAHGELSADAVVVAVPHRSATDLVPDEACTDRPQWAGLGSSAIVNVHLRFDTQVTSLPFAAVLDSPIQWIFDRTDAAQCNGQYLVMPVSGAEEICDQPAEKLIATHVRELPEFLPRARTARLLDSFVTREPHATFRQGVGAAVLRPSAATAIPNLVLAGAWTATGWPDTMEGAVRSGLTAARILGRPVSSNRPATRSVIQK